MATTTTIIQRDDTRPDGAAVPTDETPVADGVRPGEHDPLARDDGPRPELPREDRRTRVALAREAGWRRISFGSVFAGVFVAYGAFALLLGVVSAVLDAIGVDTDGLSSSDWRGIGIGSAAALFVVLLVTYFYGGYVAGRMARRSGLLNGACVALVGVALLALGAGILIGLDATDAIRDRLQDLGAPTSGGQWADIGSAAGIAGLVAMVVGATLGGIRGERWHDRLVARAADPAYGPSATATDTPAAVPTAVSADETAAPPADSRQPDSEPVAAETDQPGPVVWSQAPAPAPVTPRDAERETATPSGP